MALTAISFSNDQAIKARYYYERLPYTGWPFAGTGGASSLATNTTTLFYVAYWNLPSEPSTWRAQLEMIQATQNTSVTLQWESDPQNQLNNTADGTTSALPAGTRQQPLFIGGVQSLKLTLNNSSGAAISGWQTNYSVGMKKLTVAEKLLAKRANLQGYSLSALEKQALKEVCMSQDELMALVAKGTLPLGIERIQQGIYENRVLSASTDLWYPQATTTANPFAKYETKYDPSRPTEGRFGIVTEISIEGSDNVTLTLDRDGQQNYMGVNGAAFVQADDSPWQVWIPFLSYANFNVALGPGASSSTNVGIRIKVLEVEMSDVIAVQFGKIQHPSQLARPDVYWKTILGVN